MRPPVQDFPQFLNERCSPSACKDLSMECACLQLQLLPNGQSYELPEGDHAAPISDVGADGNALIQIALTHP